MKSLILILVVFSFDSLAMSWFPREPKELKEIKLSGSYYPGGQGEIERTERYYREHGRLKEGQTLADIHLAHKLEYLGKERFRTGRDWKPIIYCYGEILDEDRETAPVIDPNLRARMYDQDGNLLAEDTLRDREDPATRDPFIRLTVAYLPYLKNGDVTIRIVRLKEEEEVILYEFLGVRSHENLKAHDRTGWNSNIHVYGSGYKLYKKAWTPERHWLPKVPCYM